MKNNENHFILVLVNVKTQTSLGVEFCKDADDLAWKREMFLNDFGRDDHVALTYPDSGMMIAESLASMATLPLHA
jgi:hypothetical protein